MTHTPGPWKFQEYMSGPEDIAQMKKLGMTPVRALTNDGSTYVMSEKGRIALVDMQTAAKRGERHKAADPERDANARAIAAVPLLIAACKEARMSAPIGTPLRKQLDAVLDAALGTEDSE